LALRNGAVLFDSHASAQIAASPRPPAEPARPPAPIPFSMDGSRPSAAASQGQAGGPLALAGSPPVATPAALDRGRVIRVTHETVYRYERVVERSSHVLRLRPVDDTTQRVLEHRLEMTPLGLCQEFEDVFGNRATTLEIETPYEEMHIRSESLVHVRGAPPLEANAPARRLTIPLVWMPWQRQMMIPYLLPPELPELQLRELSDFAMSFVERQGSDLIETIVDMNRTIVRDFAYISGSTTLETTPYEVYSSRKGVCQDFANLLICLARLLNIPARYRVGYIHTGADYANRVQSEASHAWVELYLPWLGWRGVDPTNGCLVGRDHVRVACGRNFRDATPTSGTIHKGGGAETLAVAVRVQIMEEGAVGSLPGGARV
jgi:transglutaminase-like putative cysteine protease